MKVLLVEPWMAGSHLAWAEGYQRSSELDVDIIGLPGQLWRWRLQGGAAPLAERLRAQVRLNGPPDLLLCSGLVDVAQLLGLTRDVIPSTVPVVTYQHESQLVYPTGDRDRSACLAEWSSWLASDRVFFNSSYHREAVRQALPSFLQQLPDDSHVELMDDVLRRFEILPVGVDLSWTDGAIKGRKGEDSAAPVILWPHRWEDDKDPEAFGRALDRLVTDGLDHRLILAGEEPTVGSSRRDPLMERHAERVIAVGPFSTEEYRRHLASADLVVSCAKHEFFGVAVVEAVAAGCHPVVPQALAYPEVLGPHAGYSPGTFGTALADAVRRGRSDSVAIDVRRFDWKNLAPRYDQEFVALIGSGLPAPVDQR